MNKYLNLLKSVIRKEIIIDEDMIGLGRKRRISLPKITNYIRVSTLELAAQEIYERNVQGAVAELGVYKGNFARYINMAFPDRTFYLFDTFDGFSAKDVAIEVNNNYSTGNQDFSDTSVNMVLQKMQHVDKCIVKKGWFPESIGDMDEQFCFVSLDADLYKPIYDGLEYFYPRLNKGGYIFIHDYNNKGYVGAKDAVRQFCSKEGINYTPMTDSWGSVVITK